MKGKRNMLFAVMACIGMVGAVFANGATETANAAYPNKEVNVIVIANAGGGTDAIARAVTNPLEKTLGKPFVVVNNGTAGGLVASEDIAHAAPDGYTLGVFSNTDVASLTYGQKSPTFSVDDFTYIATLNTTGDILVLKKGSSFSSIEELVAYAKANPGKVTIGLPSPAQEMTRALFEKATGTKLTQVMYGGGNKVFADILGGHVEMGVLGAKFIKQAEEQNVNILGVTLESPLSPFPEVPTFKSQGYDIINPASRMLVGPKGIPQEKIDVLVKALQTGFQGEMKTTIEATGEVPYLTTGADLRKFLESDFAMRKTYYQGN